MVISEVKIQGHSCLVMDPPVIAPGAPVIMLLHGLGTNADDLAPLCEQFLITHCRFVLPDAPLHLPGYPGGAFAWYDFQAHNHAEIVESRKYLFEVMDHFAKDPKTLGPEKEPAPILIMGFSQGGVMAMEAGVNYKGKIAGIVSMSGYMPDPAATLKNAAAPFETPILLVHGTEDDVVPIQGSRFAEDALRQTGYKPALKEFIMGHEISQGSLIAVREFLKKHVGNET